MTYIVELCDPKFGKIQLFTFVSYILQLVLN